MCEFERRNADVTYLELFKPRMLYRTHIGVFTQIWSQLTGMNVMMYYITYVFGKMKLSSILSLVGDVCAVPLIPARLKVDSTHTRLHLIRKSGSGLFFSLSPDLVIHPNRGNALTNFVNTKVAY